MFFEWMNRPEGSRVLYSVKIVCLALMGAVLAAMLLKAYLPDSDEPAGDAVYLFFTIVVMAPIIETLLMWGIIAVLQRLLQDMRVIAFVSAGIWAGLHASEALVWGAIVFWPFLLFSITFLTWQRRSTNEALIMTAATHALYNLVPGLMVINAA